MGQQVINYMAAMITVGVLDAAMIVARGRIKNRRCIAPVLRCRTWPAIWVAVLEIQHPDAVCQQRQNGQYGNGVSQQAAQKIS